MTWFSGNLARRGIYCPALSQVPGNPPQLAKSQLLHELRQIVGDASDEELQGLLDMFHSTAAERVQEARAALADRDLATLRRASHTLRTMGACIGAWDLAGIASKLEHWAATHLEAQSAEDRTAELLAASMISRMDEELARVKAVAAPHSEVPECRGVARR